MCKWRGTEIIGVYACIDHIHKLLEIPLKLSISSVIEYLKGKSHLITHEKWRNLRFKYRNSEFGCRGQYEDTSKKIQVNLKSIKKDTVKSYLTLDLDQENK